MQSCKSLIFWPATSVSISGYVFRSVFRAFLVIGFSAVFFGPLGYSAHAGDALVSRSKPQYSTTVEDGNKILRGLVRFPDGIYFRPGATRGEVRRVMGPPTRVDGNIWYYGDSEVVFSVSLKVPVVVGYYIRTVPLRIYDRDPFFTP